MAAQNTQIWEITFELQSPFLLITPELLSEVIARCQNCRETILSLDMFYPSGLIKYLERVLASNQSETSAPAGGAAPDDIFTILLTQLESLHVSRSPWFSALEYTQDSGKRASLFAGYTREAQEISREGGIFLYRPKDHFPCFIINTEMHH